MGRVSRKSLRAGWGFTLVELALVIVVLGILSVVAIPQFIDFTSSAKDAVTRDEMLAIKKAIVGDGRSTVKGKHIQPAYEPDMGKLPSKLEDLAKNPSTGDTTQDYNPLTRSGWRGPYVDTSSQSDYSTDAWGGSYVYSSASRYVRSWGPDKTDDSGGNDDIDLSF